VHLISPDLGKALPAPAFKKTTSADRESISEGDEGHDGENN
jgi:hypothetical protein